MSGEFTVRGLGSGGDGVAGTPGYPVYIPFALPGEIVTAEILERRKGSARARLLEIKTPAPDRAEPPCLHFSACGGCVLQHLAPDAYRSWIKDRIAAAMSYHGFKDCEILDPVISPPGARRRTAWKAHRKGGRVRIGYHERASHALVDISSCPVLHSRLLALLDPLRATLGMLLEDNARATLHLTLTDTGVDLAIEAAAPLTLSQREVLAAFAEAQDLANLVWREGGFEDPVAMRRPPVLRFGGVSVRTPPGGFLQATAEGEAALTAAVTAALAQARHAADLFSGIGTFTFPLAAQGVRVTAIEGAKAALDCLANAARAQGLGAKIAIQHRDLFRRPLLTQELDVFDAVVIDPPRTGAEAQMAMLARSKVPLVAAVSCNPNTFARDARILSDGGYSIGPILPVGQFLWSAEVELAVLFSRK